MKRRLVALTARMIDKAIPQEWQRETAFNSCHQSNPQCISQYCYEPMKHKGDHVSFFGTSWRRARSARQKLANAKTIKKDR